ncbi:hypothetical protein SAMN05414137_120182 [Streptacidiphilus jiangxiensis]|uniref:Uncharacterized protein n=1 Tax=Streptacidiphilus jiangxiensis TaxID=235985 RepID=A0A1H7WIB5_STRJI|nr:hypothetical protein SAMN05414137_120182 [Streptacidiphilus jiangxiensis]
MPHTACSPRPRGWSLDQAGCSVAHRLLPAPAGMVPAFRTCSAGLRSAPRARGDGPGRRAHRSPANHCSPRPRGWSLGDQLGERVVLAAPRARGDGPRQAYENGFRLTCSPRPRGWSRRPGRRGGAVTLLPAPAGMVPATWASTRAAATAPRARGNGPAGESPGALQVGCSPRPRGWSPLVTAQHRDVLLLPAPAGMVSSTARRPNARPTALRARGDGPPSDQHPNPGDDCSPRPGGWSRPRGRSRVRPSCSPRLRGWSRGGAEHG